MRREQINRMTETRYIGRKRGFHVVLLQKTSWCVLCALFCAIGTAFQLPSKYRSYPHAISQRLAHLEAAKMSISEDGMKLKPRRQKSTRKAGDKNVEERARAYRPLLDHQILTMEEEQDLGKKIGRAIEVKKIMAIIIEEKHAQEFEKLVKEQEYNRRMTEGLLYDENEYSHLHVGYDEDLEGLSIHCLDVESLEEVKRYGEDLGRIRIQSTEEYVDGLVVARENSNDDFVSEEEITSPEVMLTDEDIEMKLGIAGGRKELSRILIDGAMARDKLISCNIRLVLSIAKKWCGSFPSNNPTFYHGSSTRPSLDEAMQEGIIGLAIAVDRFDYKKNLKFGTYATYWITNSVRRCFQTASAGCIRVPADFHQIRQNYHKLVMAHYKETGGEGLAVDTAADELGLKPRRLQFVLRATQRLLSLDAPLPDSKIQAQAGKSGSLESSAEAYLANTLSCSELLPDERVEMSLLRQCLENAMATELSPHERDVLRLKHGLDDGVSRSAREVCDLLGTVSVSDVTKSESSAFRKLRSPYSVHTYQLMGFLNYVGIDPDAAKESWS